mmetsp:Transcript_2493/g.5281  ORF Transcript_2493/g.5281 Transcript_2493/m.5281 type:complete len:274 (-) Transcript_2493:250-1071(-)
MATLFARRASGVSRSEPLVNTRKEVIQDVNGLLQHCVLSAGGRRNNPFLFPLPLDKLVAISISSVPVPLRCRELLRLIPVVLSGNVVSSLLVGEFVLVHSLSYSSSLLLSDDSEDLGEEFLCTLSKCVANSSSGSGNAYFDMRKYNNDPAPNDRSRCKNTHENMGMRVIPNIKKEFSVSRSVFCAFCGIELAARHSGPMETTLTVTMTLPANARLNAIVDGLTFLLPLLLLRSLDGLPSTSSDRSSSSSSSSMGWQNTIKAPKQVDIPASVDR